MATKQVKKTVVVTSKTLNSSSSESVQSPFRARSPSPARISRLQEKEQLTGLNDRLAAYIDHIRSLENENQRLHVQVQTFEETNRREVSSVKDLYEKELAAARKLIDDLAKENAQLTISVGTYKSEAEEWMRKYSLKDRELTLLQKKLDEIDCQLKDLENKLSAALRDADKAKADYQRVRVELSDLERQLASARKQLEEETLAKVDLENKVQSLKEELSFKAQLHQSELNETRTRMEYSIDEVDSRTQREVENRLQEALAEFRQQHDIQTKNLREELELLYEAKIAGLQKELETQDGADEKTRTEISIYKSKITELQSQITKLANQNATLEARIASLEADLTAERDQYRAMLDSKDREIRLIRDQIEEQLLEYQDLLDIKVSLDLEIAAYRKLLEGEEERLSQSYSSVKSTPRKRRRGDDEAMSTFIEEAQSKSAFTSSGRSSGSCEISEVSEDGKYVKVKNNSSEEVSLGGWKLIQRVGDDQSDYKFTRAAKLGAGEVATIWSSDAGVSADAATHTFVMKGTKWLTGDSVQTSLTDKEGREQASFELTKTTQRTILKGTRLSTAQPLGADNNGRCSVM